MASPVRAGYCRPDEGMSAASKASSPHRQRGRHPPCPNLEATTRRPSARGDPDNMLDLIHSCELPEFPLGSNGPIKVEGEPPFVSGSVRPVRGGSIAGAAEGWRRSD